MLAKYCLERRENSARSILKGKCDIRNSENSHLTVRNISLLELEKEEKKGEI